MILVSFCGVEHDNSISVYDNGKVRYSKYEREVGIKHARPLISWYSKKLEEWGIDYRDVDVFATNYTAPLDSFGNLLPYSAKMDEDTITYPINNEKSSNFLVNHHFSHALSNLNFNFKNSRALVIDSCMHDNTWMHNTKYSNHNIYTFKSSGIILDELGHKIGLNGLDLDFAGKIMGLQSYGNPNLDIINSWKELLPYESKQFSEWVKSQDIGSNYTDQNFLDFIATVFWTCYEINAKYFQHFSKDDEIIYSGGTALNVSWNRKLLDSGYKLNIQPHVGDEGLSIGGLKLLCDLYDVPCEFSSFPYIQDDECPTTTPTPETIERVAELLAEDKIVGWYQGHGEVGPRALGNRSILMNPSIKDGKDIINQKVKHREWWRPFGASVKQDKSHEYFDLDNSPYMLYASKVLSNDLPSVTHVDGTCRHQTVTPEQNELFYDLLDQFEQKTGLPVLLNTSLNLGGKPIAGKIKEAVELFQNSEMDALCVGDELYVK